MAGMAIEIGDDRSFVSFELIERMDVELPCAGDINLDVKAHIGCIWGACTAHYQLWFAKEDVERFLVDLKSLDKTDTGSALMKSMSPEEFSMELMPTRHPDHIKVRISMEQASVAAGPESVNLTTVFETLHRGQLRSLASGLHNFLEFGVDLN
jgi:hypothetical protein